MLVSICLAAVALTPAPLRPLFITASATAGRLAHVVAQLPPGWTSLIDEASGRPYYYHEQTRAAQWEPPFAAEDYGAPQIFCSVAPTAGVGSEYALRNGDHVMVGRYDMLAQSPYVSRQQCLVRVDADGTATITSMGKPPTALRAPDGRWYCVHGGQTHNLEHGQEFSLDVQNPESAVFTVYLQQQQQQQQGGYYAEYDHHHQQQQGGYGYDSSQPHWR